VGWGVYGLRDAQAAQRHARQEAASAIGQSYGLAGTVDYKKTNRIKEMICNEPQNRPSRRHHVD